MFTNKLLRLLILSLTLFTVSFSINTIAAVKSEITLNSIFDDKFLGVQIKYFEKKFDLTPMTINKVEITEDGVNEIKAELRSYEIGECTVTVLVQSNTMAIIVLKTYIGDKCNVIVNGDDSRNITFNKLKAKWIDSDYPPKFTVMLNPGNWEGSDIGEVFVQGARYNGNVSVNYTFENNDGISKWRDYIKVNDEKSWGNEIIDPKFYKDALKMWGDGATTQISITKLKTCGHDFFSYFCRTMDYYGQ